MRLAIVKGRAALAVAIAAAGVIAGPGSAGAASLGGLSVRPAHFEASTPATRAYFVRSVRPGGSFNDAVVVTNTSGAALDAYVYPVDGLTGATSGSVYANRQDRRRRAGKWLRIAIRSVHVPPRSAVTVAFKLRVPRSARAGDHLAGIAVENARPTQSPGRFSVTEITRAVIGVLVKVPGSAKPQLRLDGLALKPLPGTPLASVVVTLVDAGQKLCKPTLTVSVGGRSARHQLDTILPGDRIAFPLPWPRRLAAGTYSATASGAGCGSPAVVRTTAKLGADLAGPGAIFNRPANAKPGSTPWWPMPLVALGGVLAGVLFARRGRRSGGARSARARS